MKSTIVLSDLHLGGVISEKRKRALLKLFHEHDVIIFNGDFLDDFWDYRATVRNNSVLFEALKSKYIVYIFGNHDRDTSELRAATDFFVNEYTDEYSVFALDHEYKIQHGHAIYPRPDEILYKTPTNIFQKMKQICAQGIWKVLYPVILWIRYRLEVFALTRALHRSIVARQNIIMRNFAEKNMKENQVLLCGHSHFQQDFFDQKFINTGANAYSRLEYLIISSDGYRLVSENI